jgi:hypothetical protein
MEVQKRGSSPSDTMVDAFVYVRMYRRSPLFRVWPHGRQDGHSRNALSRKLCIQQERSRLRLCGRRDRRAGNSSTLSGVLLYTVRYLLVDTYLDRLLFSGHLRSCGNSIWSALCLSFAEDTFNCFCAFGSECVAWSLMFQALSFLAEGPPSTECSTNSGVSHACSPLHVQYPVRRVNYESRILYHRRLPISCLGRPR